MYELELMVVIIIVCLISMGLIIKFGRPKYIRDSWKVINYITWKLPKVKYDSTDYWILQDIRSQLIDSVNVDLYTDTRNDIGRSSSIMSAGITSMLINMAAKREGLTQEQVNTRYHELKVAMHGN